MRGDYVPIEKLDVTTRFEALSDWIWDQVMKWSKLAQDTIGKQVINASDSVAANIVEGGNLEGDPDSLRFFGYARGSAGETGYWLRRSIKRRLIDEDDGNRVLREWETAFQMLNSLIKYRRSVRWKVREESAKYNISGAVEPEVGQEASREG